MAHVEEFVTTLTLASGASGDSLQVPCEGAARVAWSVKCNTTHQLTVCSVQLIMTDDKVVTVVPAALPTGTDGTLAEVNCAGGAITADLSSATHRGIILRPIVAAAPYAYGTLMNVKRALLTLTKAATAGNAIYTIQARVYYN